MRFKKIIDINKKHLEEHFHEHDNPLLFDDEEGLSINENDKIIIFGNNASGKTRIIKYLDETISKSNYEIIIKKIDFNIFRYQSVELLDMMERFKIHRTVNGIPKAPGSITDELMNKYFNELTDEILINLNNGIKMIILLDNFFHISIFQ